MTPKEKAEDLYSIYNSFGKLNDSEVKECALIAVDEIIEEVRGGGIVGRSLYWKEVKQEIEKL